MSNESVEVRPLDAGIRAWAAALLEEAWGSSLVVSRGRLHDALALPGFAAIKDGSPVGLVTYHLEDDACELITLNSLQPGEGIGTALLQAVKETAKQAACRRLWLITTNDNMEALRFYQVKGFVLVALYRNALEVSRQLKPQIPVLGQFGIPLRDELELELVLEAEA